MYPGGQYNHQHRGFEQGQDEYSQYNGNYQPPSGPPPPPMNAYQQGFPEPQMGPPMDDSGYQSNRGHSSYGNGGGQGGYGNDGGQGGYNNGGGQGGYGNGGFGGYGQQSPPPPMPMANPGGYSGGGDYGGYNDGYNSNGGGYGNNDDYNRGGGYGNSGGYDQPPQMPYGGQGYGGPPSQPPAAEFPGNRYMGGPPGPPPQSDGYQMPGGSFGMPPPMNMPVVRHRPEDIDFAGNNFPGWHQTPAPPSGQGYSQGQGQGQGQGQPGHGQIPTYNIPQEIQQEASAVQLSNCRGRKRALLIGINYFNTKHLLKGCINDVHNMKKFITQHFGFREQDMVILTDDQRDNPRRMPTHENIIKAMKWLVSDARMNDSFFFHYSGHGNVVASRTGDEIDGNDETICPVDFESRGQIIDDDMNAIMVRPLPRGARLTAIFDCCHSATALDLPFMYNHMGKLKNEKAISFVGKGLMAAGNKYLKGDLGGALQGLTKSLEMFATGDQKLEKSRRTKSTMGDVIMFSGCKDDQTSADTKTEDLAFTGAMSHALVSSMNSNPHQTYVQLLQDIRRRLAPKYTQVPQLSTGRLMDMNTIFIM
ncbi:Ca(2+)-dependent cysteine protease [Coemansia sp. RSA 1286]|nr:Ca(2+)-dependent cysteine protease [Coemansia sp. RSA 485]KAJ2636017.1 Ca(2+)-dependent cysteine protease [Coemansia sp. RSA 1286]